MEKEVDVENNSTKHKLIMTKPDWLDLPEPIATNIILEHLEIVDYIRFSAVCKKWYSIQKEHRIRYSPYPPPVLLPFPWLRCTHCSLEKVDDRSILFYQPDKQKSYNIQFCSTSKTVLRTSYGHECILLLFESVVFNPPVVHILNPITGVQRKLPSCFLSKSAFRIACISSWLTDPNCTLLTVNYDDEAYLYRLNDNCCWRKIDLYSKTIIWTSAFCNNKFYYMGWKRKLYMIDTLLHDPVERMIEMDCSEIHVVPFEYDAGFVDFFGELLMIVIKQAGGVFEEDTEEFQVYRADFSTNKWVRMETLGDSALFYSPSNTFALRAVDVGCKKNTIYSTKGFKRRRLAWRAFDLSTRDWIDGPPLSLSNGKYHSKGRSYTLLRSKESFPIVSWSWFFPTLNYFSGANTNASCQNICLDT